MKCHTLTLSTFLDGSSTYLVEPGLPVIRGAVWGKIDFPSHLTYGFRIPVADCEALPRKYGENGDLLLLGDAKLETSGEDGTQHRLRRIDEPRARDQVLMKLDLLGPQTVWNFDGLNASATIASWTLFDPVHQLTTLLLCFKVGTRFTVDFTLRPPYSVHEPWRNSAEYSRVCRALEDYSRDCRRYERGTKSGSVKFWVKEENTILAVEPAVLS